MIRSAKVASKDPQTIAAYLPANYNVIRTNEDDGTVIISGEDNAGWTLDGYVIPRLASGLHFAEEFKPCTSHPHLPVHNMNMCEYCYDNYREALDEKGH